MKAITWKDLQEKLSNLSEEQLMMSVYVSIDDEDVFTKVEDLHFIGEDIYIHIESCEMCGTLAQLKESDEDFDMSNYILATKKGTPFLWDGL